MVEFISHVHQMMENFGAAAVNPARSAARDTMCRTLSAAVLRIAGQTKRLDAAMWKMPGVSVTNTFPADEILSKDLLE